MNWNSKLSLLTVLSILRALRDFSSFSFSSYWSHFKPWIAKVKNGEDKIFSSLNFPGVCFLGFFHQFFSKQTPKVIKFFAKIFRDFVRHEPNWKKNHMRKKKKKIKCDLNLKMYYLNSYYLFIFLFKWVVFPENITIFGSVIMLVMADLISLFNIDWYLYVKWEIHQKSLKVGQRTISYVHFF